MPIAETTGYPLQIVREAECRRLTGLSRAQRYKLERAGRFPRRVPLDEGSAHHGWILGDIEAWIRKRVAERDSLAAGRAAEAREHVAA